MSGSIATQIDAKFEQVEAGPWRGGARLWLTFYLGGQPENLERLARHLGEGGWVNLGGSEGGFLYPKREIGKTRADAIEAALGMQAICAKHGVDILAIDADTSAEVQSSDFVTLYCPLAGTNPAA